MTSFLRLKLLTEGCHVRPCRNPTTTLVSLLSHLQIPWLSQTILAILIVASNTCSKTPNALPIAMTENESEAPQNGSVTYRGGFSSSIYDVFQDHGHSDCCVLTCCGILLYDRNFFLLTEKRPSWRGRCGVLVCFLILAVAFVGALVAASYLFEYEQQHLEETQADGKKPTKDDVSRIEQVKTLANVATICRILIWAMIIYLLFKAGQYRYRARRFLLVRLYRERREAGEQDNEQELARATDHTPLVQPAVSEATKKYLESQRYNTWCSTAPVGCIPKDAIVDPSNPVQTHKTTDFCDCLVKLLSFICCGAFCGCWCQCLGLCAIAQEDRELRRMLPKEKFEVDYITFQPFADYFPKLEALRQNKINNMFSHFTELSDLSAHLLRSMLVVLALLAVLAFSRFDPLFQPAHLLVVCMTLLQGIFIVYFVHWQWNRFDLSVDAIIKYFASGFLLCTANAFVYETFVQNFVSFTANFIYLFGPLPAGDDDRIGSGDDETGAEQRFPIWALLIMAFLNAFAVAALVEEVSKYFGYWMVEHPDLALPSDFEGDDTGTAEEQNTNRTASHRTMKSLGAGITVAMVTTAVGFACCENFVYVFVYSRTANAANELITLVARSIFPVHPLAAAIQSIGVCQRDVEKDSSTKFGNILLPALLLHGFFDFALMFLDYLGRGSWRAPAGLVGAKVQTSPDPSLQNNAGQALGAIICSVSIVLIGVVYYVVKALAQRRRLEELDKRRQGSGEYERLP